MRAQQGRSDDTGVTAVLIELTATCVREGGKWENLHADGSPEISLSPVMALPSGFIEPCLPSKMDRPPIGPLWVHEIKHDG